MEFKLLKCPVCGAEGNLKKSETPQGERWSCAYCGSKFAEDNAEREYDKLKGAICDSLAGAIDSALLSEKQNKYYNLRYMLWEKITAKYIDSHAIVTICRDIKKIEPHDFLAEFFELANTADADDVAAYINGIDVYENLLYIDLVLDFLLKSMLPEYITPVNLLIERAYRKQDLQKLGEYMTRLEEEVLKLDAYMYETKMPRDVFIAYSSKDIDTVIEVINAIEESGLSCFAAFRNLQHGRDAVKNYEAALKEAIDNCKILVFISSKHSRSFKCDAFDKELTYIKDCDLNANPMYRNNYEALPQVQRKPRIEYRLDDTRAMGPDIFMKEFFAGLDYCETLEKVIARIIECKRELANPMAIHPNQSEDAHRTGRDSTVDTVHTASDPRIQMISNPEFDEEVRKKLAEIKSEEERRSSEAKAAEDARRSATAQLADEARKANAVKRAVVAALPANEAAKFCEIRDGVLYKFKDPKGEIKHLTIPDYVTSIFLSAFDKCTSLETIIIPGTVKKIGSSAFNGCKNLKNLVISHGVTEIDYGAFNKCSSLETLELPDSITKLATSAFAGCSSIKSVVIPESIERIGNYAFDACTSLEEVIITDGVKEIGEAAFKKCTALKIVTIPNSVSLIDNFAFWDCTALKELFIPSSVIRMGHGLLTSGSIFTGCTCTLYCEHSAPSKKWCKSWNLGFQGKVIWNHK